MVSELANALINIYGKVKYTLMSFLLKLVICNYTFVKMKLQFSTFKIY